MNVMLEDNLMYEMRDNSCGFYLSEIFVLYVQELILNKTFCQQQRERYTDSKFIALEPN